MKHRPPWAAGLALLSLCLAGCSNATASTGKRMLTVYAAASLTEAFSDIEDAFEADHPDVDVAIAYAGSSSLAAQIVEGAPADVFASADIAQMDVALENNGAQPTFFATNTLTMIVESGNPLNLSELEDLGRADVTAVVCAPAVPCGAATFALAKAQGVTLRPSSEEASVTDVVGKVGSGQADAGVVYVTDVARAPGVDTVALRGAVTHPNRYPIVAFDGGPAEELAQGFVNFVTGPDGTAVLTAHGFGAP